ncbi:uncharacterized protein LOC115219930 [Octopus sinensis]|uniref:Uncharacterized protein LOC115219930 n=1 Tax=Octopus sinensis TaxID=2607531 RepID=A0A6P7T6R6_9MOLL|nr:uncharacterized protein LOC115219930 [Octopus sinensis]
MKFYLKLWKSATETLSMFWQAYDNKAMDRTECFEWHGHKVNIRHIFAKFAPYLLTTEQKEHRIEVCQDFHQCAADDPPFMSRIITGDESWVHGYDPEVKQQLSSPQPKKAQQNRSSFIVFFGICGIMHREFVLQGQTIN